MFISENEKRLYNTYLYVTRTERNKPVTLRKNFDNLDELRIQLIQKIYRFLIKYPHIDYSDYFRAPYKLYPDTEKFDLEYYADMRGVTAYTEWVKTFNEMDPDSDIGLSFIAKSLKFIGMFCVKNKITLDEYPLYKTVMTSDWMKHFKNHNISIYVVIELPNIYDILSKTPQDEIELFLGEYGKRIMEYKNRLYQSKEAKILVKQGMEKIKNYITINTTNKKGE